MLRKSLEQINVLQYFILRDIYAQGSMSPLEWARNHVSKFATLKEIGEVKKRFQTLARRALIKPAQKKHQFYVTDKGKDLIHEVRVAFGFQNL